MALEFSRAAENDLLDIFLYGIQEHGLTQAELYKGYLETAFQTLSENPRITRLREESTPAVRVYPIQKHMIIHTILEDGQTVHVLRVRHHSENWTARPIE